VFRDGQADPCAGIRPFGRLTAGKAHAGRDAEALPAQTFFEMGTPLEMNCESRKYY